MRMTVIPLNRNCVSRSYWLEFLQRIARLAKRPIFQSERILLDLKDFLALCLRSIRMNGVLIARVSGRLPLEAFAIERRTRQEHECNRGGHGDGNRDQNLVNRRP